MRYMPGIVFSYIFILRGDTFEPVWTSFQFQWVITNTIMKTVMYTPEKFSISGFDKQ